MTKPDDISQDVWRAAQYICTQESIARAIMAEREACVQVAASFPENIGLTKARMVEAIRNRGR